MALGQKLFYAGGCVFELARGVIFFALVLLLTHLFVATIFVVDGISMETNFHTNQIVVVNRWTYLTGSPQRGDVVVLRFPGDPEHKKYIKRLIGMPGDTIDLQNDRVYVNGKLIKEPYLKEEVTPVTANPPKTHWVVPTDSYYLLGDNRPYSSDSRIWDTAEKRYLIGKAVFVAWPLNQSAIVPKETYSL